MKSDEEGESLGARNRVGTSGERKSSGGGRNKIEGHETGNEEGKRNGNGTVNGTAGELNVGAAEQMNGWLERQRRTEPKSGERNDERTERRTFRRQDQGVIKLKKNQDESGYNNAMQDKQKKQRRAKREFGKENVHICVQKKQRRTLMTLKQKGKGRKWAAEV